MNFFRSEEHLRKWEGFKERNKGGIIGLNSLMQLFSGPYFKNRMDPDWVSHMGEYTADMIGALDKLQGAGDHWRMSSLERLGFSMAKKLGLV